MPSLAMRLTMHSWYTPFNSFMILAGLYYLQIEEGGRESG